MSGWRNPANQHLPLDPRLQRKRSFVWSRRPNGFSDNPKWRAVKAHSGLDLCIVLAFVNRLEELANDAANRGDLRGSVAEFKAHDFAAALDISANDANKLYASLEHPDIGWIADGVIVDFHDRNPDMEDPTATERQRRHRSRGKILRKLGNLARAGVISNEDCKEIEIRLPQLDHAQLISLQTELEGKSLQTIVTRDSRMSRRDGVTPSPVKIEAPSSGSFDASETTRDNVTVTPDQNRQYEANPSATMSDATSGELVGLAGEEDRIVPEAARDPARWLKENGAELIRDRMGETPERATARLARWSEQVQDCAVLSGILQRAQNRSGHGFHMEVTDQIKRLAH